MRLSNNYSIQSNNSLNSNPSFKALYTNSKTVDLIDTYITHGAPSLTNSIKTYVNKLNDLTRDLKTDVVIEKGTEEYTARIVEVKDHFGIDTYKIIGYLTEEKKLPDALESAIKKLTARQAQAEKAKQPIRQRFPGRNSLDIKG